jgi:uncharacterized membrane protein
MFDLLLFASVLASAIGSALIAGLFFAFSVSIMPALARRPPAEGLAAMQAINVVIVNPLFLLVFLGTGVTCLAVLGLAVSPWRASSALFVAGAVLYLVGSLLLTMAINVPMNNALVDKRAWTDDGAAYWALYLSRWTAWNHVRTVASLAALIALMLGLMRL